MEEHFKLIEKEKEAQETINIPSKSCLLCHRDIPINIAYPHLKLCLQNVKLILFNELSV